MEIDIFEHFEMIQTGIFFKPQRRKANEGVRISHLDPETRMNSRDEFRQGTNIMMRAMRGVGVWQAVLFNQGWRVLVQVQQCPKKREFSARRGSRTRRRGTVMPLRGYLLKQCRSSLMYSAFTLTFSAMFWFVLFWFETSPTFTFCGVCQESLQS